MVAHSQIQVHVPVNQQAYSFNLVDNRGALLLLVRWRFLLFVPHNEGDANVVIHDAAYKTGYTRN